MSRHANDATCIAAFLMILSLTACGGRGPVRESVDTQALALTTANDFLATTGAAEPGWKDQHPAAGPCHALFASSDESPDAFECEVTCDQADCGSVIVETAGPEPAVASWSSSGPGFVPALLARVKTPQRVRSTRAVRLSPVHFALEVTYEDGAKEQIFHEQPIQDYAVVREELKQRKHKQIVEAWREVDAAPEDALPDGVRTTRQALILADRNVPGAGVMGSISPIPAYVQPKINKCRAGCTPTAFAMLLGYYDIHGRSNLITYWGGYVPQTAQVTATIWALNQRLGTICLPDGAGSTSNKYYVNVAAYASQRGYAFSSGVYTGYGRDSSIFNRIRIEIDAGRPALLNYYLRNGDFNSGHSVAVYGYKITRSSSGKTYYYLRINLGWSSTRFTTVSVSGNDFKSMGWLRPW